MKACRETIEASVQSMTHERKAYTMLRIMTKELFCTVMWMYHKKKRDSFKVKL